MRPGFDVVVPVYDGADVLGETLRRLAAFGGPGERFILVDDASGDARTVALLAQAAADPRFTVHRLAANGGFVAAANAGLALATRDVVLLNADAWVTAGWLDRLHECRASAPAIGCACPLSNHATLLTIAEAAAAGLDPDAIAAAVARASAREYVRLPTAHGFCMLLAREAIDRVGVLDEAFGRGYGEENDWSLRAIRAGFEIACADGAYVHHVGEASFGRSARTERLRRRNAALLSARWPGYRAGVRGWLRDNPLRETIERATSEIRRAAGMPGRRLLVVTWKYGHPGGIEEHLRQALPALAKAFDTTVLCLDRLHGAWADAIERRDASGVRIVQWGVEGLSVTRAISGVPAGLSDARAERFVRAMLAAGGYDLVHFHSLAGWNSLALPAIAREAGCRTVFTVHDFHLLCPEGNLVDPSDRPCGKARASARDEGCLACLAPRDRAAPGSPSLAGLLLEREVAAARALEAFDRIIAPSRFAAGRLARAFPELAPRITVIPHGVEAGRLPPPPRSSELRVAFLGRFSRRKGAAVVLEAAAMLRDEMIEFAVFGPLEPGLAAPAPGARIRFHGPYRREDLPVLLRDADLVLVPSVVEESFGLVFSEAQALGIPVVASPLGALAERLVDGENGFAFPAGDAGALATLLRRLCRAMHRVEDVRARLRQATVTPVAESVAMTLAAYDEVLAGAVPAPRWIAAAPRAPVADMATWLRLDAGPSAGPWMRAKAMPPLVTMRVVVRVAAGCGPLLARTVASLGDFAPVTVLGEGERPGPVAEETVLALEAGDEVDLSVLAGATRWLREHPGCELVAFDEARITRSGERYGVLRRAGVNRGALECGAALGRVLARTRVIEPGGDLPFDGATLALALLARKGRAAVAHRAELLAHRIDVPAPPEPADAPSRPVPAFAVVIRVEERRPPIASALQFWRHPAWGPAPVVVLLEAQAPQATLLSGALAGGATAVDLAGASGAKSRLDRVLSSLAEDFALVQSDRVAWLDAEAPRALLRAAAGPDVAIATALLASDGERVIHAGYTLGAGGAGLFGNVLEGWNVSEPPPAPFDTPVYDVAAASRLALAVRRAAWRDGQPEGEECNLEFAIVEQGLALTQAGGRVVACTEARAVLLPPAGIPVDTPTTPAMRTAFLRRWSARIADDPLHSPRLSLDPPWREESRFGAWRGDPQVAARVVVLPPVPDSPEASRVRESLASLAAAGRAAVMVPSEASRPVTIAQVIRLVPRVVVMQEPFDEARLATWRDLAALGFARRVLLADARPGDWNARSALKRAASLATRVVVADRGLGQDLHGRCPDIRVLPGFAPDPGAWAQAILD